MRAARTVDSRCGIRGDDVRRDGIFGLGNSEGTLHVLHHQLDAPDVPFAGLVLAAPPGRSVGAVARSQLAAQAVAVPNGDELMRLYDEAIDRFTAGQPMAPDPRLPEGVRNLLAALETPATSHSPESCGPRMPPNPSVG